MPGFSQVLDALKIRGVDVNQAVVDLEAFIQREYVAAVGQPILAGASSNALFTVPASENWRIFGFSCDIVQAGGAAAPTGMRFSAGPTGTRLFLAFYHEQNLGACSVFNAAAVNVTNEHVLVLPAGGLMLPPLSAILYTQQGGDGTITANFAMYMQRIQSNQVIQF
jgi:hypothetical protein